MIIKKGEIEAIDFKGLTILDYTSKNNENSSFAVINVPPAASHPLSWSKRSDKYYYITEGKIDFAINDENFPMETGDFCIVKKGEKFQYKNNSGQRTTLILVHTPDFDLNSEVFEES